MRNHFNETDVSFHTFLVRSLHPHKDIIKKIHPSTLCTDISTLDELGYQVKHVYNIKDKNKRPFPLFFVKIFPNENNKDIHNIKLLPKWLSKNRTKRTIVFHNFIIVNFFAIRKTIATPFPAMLNVVCNILTNAPDIKIVKCTLCSGDHTTKVNLRDCPAFKKVQKIIRPSIAPTTKVPEQYLTLMPPGLKIFLRNYPVLSLILTH